MSTEEPRRQPDDSGMPGWKFLLFIMLPLLLIFAAMFIAFAPKKPLGGPNKFGPPAELDADAMPAE